MGGTYGSRAASEAVKKHNDEAKKRGLFCSLANDGDLAVVAFLPMPSSKEADKDVYCYVEESVGFGSDSEPYDPRRHKESDRRLRTKFGVYVLKTASKPDKDDEPEWQEVKRVQILGLSATAYATWQGRFKKYGYRWYYVIERHGKAKSKKTIYTFDPDVEIEAEHWADILKLELPELDVSGEDDEDDDDDAKKAKNKGKGKNGPTEPPADGLVGDEVAQDVIARLKSLPNDPEPAKAFVSHFGLTKIRDLKRSQKEEAYAWILAAEEKAKPKDSGGGSTSRDPFASKPVDPYA